MHDVVRDFAHWLTSKGENRFMVKDGLKEWPNVGERLGSCTYTAMALWNCSCLDHFPKTVEYPKLKTLFLNGEGSRQVLSTDFGEMKALQVLFLSGFCFSLEGLQSLTNLRTLCCANCRLENMSSLRNMTRLEILALIGTDIIPEESVELPTLKSLFLYHEYQKKHFPPNLLSRLTSLQELHVMSKNNINLVELSSLSRLTSLTLQVSSDGWFNENFVLPELQRIWELESSCRATATLQNLKEVTIEGCHKLKVIFPPCLAPRLPSLESVELWNCPQLKQVFRPTEERDIIGNQIVLNLPSLRKLSVRNFPKLECFIVQSQQMEELVLDDVGNGCQLCRIGVPMLNQDCMVVGNHEEVFRVQGGLYSFSSIKVVELQNLYEVRIVWKDLGGVVTLDNLTTLCLCDCKRLRYVFTPSIARSLSRLVNLYIRTCEELEGIILGMDQVPSSSNVDTSLQPITFPNLTSIEVTFCNNLKSLLPLGSATSLQQLKRLEVESNMKLEQLFEAEEEIKFDKLERLGLADMPCLIDFCPKGYHFVFPGLSYMGVRRCPKMTASFFIDSKQIVHYKTEKETQGSTPNAIHDKNIYWVKGGHEILEE
ncbi:hypothetical protein V6N11_041938 [Hibiscus sabdariffa]|uniref:Disease resistance protein At4g27190-like leucine-rich repeats domain-containing protein n=1 Tax=Hibiscus sabdariffa TaxID=183260 RepID=A0ABR2N7C4_9ROSI